MNYVNTKFLLNERPQGMPSDSCWILETENITDLKNNEILIELSTYLLTLTCVGV